MNRVKDLGMHGSTRRQQNWAFVQCHPYCREERHRGNSVDLADHTRLGCSAAGDQEHVGYCESNESDIDPAGGHRSPEPETAVRRRSITASG